MELKEGDLRIPRLGPIYFTCGNWTPPQDSDEFSPNDILPTDSDTNYSDGDQIDQN